VSREKQRGRRAKRRQPGGRTDVEFDSGIDFDNPLNDSSFEMEASESVSNAVSLLQNSTRLARKVSSD
jgi:hypothetical protein